MNLVSESSLGLNLAIFSVMDFDEETAVDVFSSAIAGDCAIYISPMFVTKIVREPYAINVIIAATQP
jgi:hypothetical protein